MGRAGFLPDRQKADGIGDPPGPFGAAGAQDRGAAPGRGEGGGEFGPEYGLFGAAGQHAFGLTRHMHEYGTTHDHMGAIAVACRKHAQLNPVAAMQADMTLDAGRSDPDQLVDELIGLLEARKII